MSRTTFSRQTNTNHQLYFRGRASAYRETGVAAQVGTSNIFVIVKGAPPIRPSSPLRSGSFWNGALLALVGGIRLALHFA